MSRFAIFHVLDSVSRDTHFNLVGGAPLMACRLMHESASPP